MPQSNPLIPTELDVNLMTRCVRVLLNEAQLIHASNFPWTAEKASKEAKSRYDRYLREARDLAGLRDRMKAAVALARAASPVQVDG